MNTIQNLQPEVATQYCMRMLSRPRPDLIADVGSYRIVMDQDSGNIARQSRYNNLPTQPVPLGPSGTNPPPMTLNRLDIDAQIDWYGGFVSITEQVLLINQDKAIEETLDLLSQSLQETEDQLQREELINSLPFVNAVGGSNGDNPTELVRSDIDSLVKLLRGNNAKFIMDSIDGEDKFGKLEYAMAA